MPGGGGGGRCGAGLMLPSQPPPPPPPSARPSSVTLGAFEWQPLEMRQHRLSGRPPSSAPPSSAPGISSSSADAARSAGHQRG